MVPQDYPRVIIEAVEPQIDCGRFPIKRTAGQKVVVMADIYKEGHDVLAAVVKFRQKGRDTWHEAPMAFWDNDRWMGEFVVEEIGRYEYTVEGYAEHYLSWVSEITKKNVPGAVLTSELLEGLAIVKRSLALAAGADQAQLAEIAAGLEAAVVGGEQDQAIQLGTAEATSALMTAYPDRSESYAYEPVLEVAVIPEKARFAAWYEFFPRSQGTVPGQHGTFGDCIRRLPDVAAMGFDVIYLPPVHPIGRTFRKGKNNSLVAEPDDVGSPWAIGNEQGGHMAIEPALGTMDDFVRFVQAANRLGIDIALDYVMNTSPDHPYVAEHPDWFYCRPDGSIKYAENPPKKYQDVYPLNFATPDREGLWQEMLKIFLFWIDKGVKTFRVDNPHTKPVTFWEWVIGEVHREHPEVVFLSEAFTKPKMMKMLAKAGYTQSYTYFTWRNSKSELTDYLTELTATEMKEYFTPNFFANTPDILPEILQIGGRPAFIMRAVLAATLSTVYGIYSGFELCENEPVPGKEEYLDSEKYEIKVRDWNAPGNITSIITRLNQIRRENPAMHEFDNLRFIQVDNPFMIGYYKATADRSNIVTSVVNLDPFHGQSSLIHLPLEEFGIGPDELFQAHDLLHDERYLWRGPANYVELSPEGKMAHVFRIRRWSHYESGFDYFI